MSLSHRTAKRTQGTFYLWYLGHFPSSSTLSFYRRICDSGYLAPAQAEAWFPRLNKTANQMCFCQGNQVKQSSCCHVCYVKKAVPPLPPPCSLSLHSSSCSLGQGRQAASLHILRPKTTPHLKCMGKKKTSQSLKRT